MAIKKVNRFVAVYGCESCGEIMLMVEEEKYMGIKKPRDPELSRFFHAENEWYYECPYCQARHRLYRVEENKVDIGSMLGL